MEPNCGKDTKNTSYFQILFLFLVGKLTSRFFDLRNLNNESTLKSGI